jgi:hypothetical protein
MILHGYDRIYRIERKFDTIVEEYELLELRISCAERKIMELEEQIMDMKDNDYRR